MSGGWSRLETVDICKDESRQVRACVTAASCWWHNHVTTFS